MYTFGGLCRAGNSHNSTLLNQYFKSSLLLIVHITTCYNTGTGQTFFRWKLLDRPLAGDTLQWTPRPWDVINTPAPARPMHKTCSFSWFCSILCHRQLRAPDLSKYLTQAHKEQEKICTNIWLLGLPEKDDKTFGKNLATHLSKTHFFSLHSENAWDGTRPTHLQHNREVVPPTTDW